MNIIEKQQINQVFADSILAKELVTYNDHSFCTWRLNVWFIKGVINKTVF